MKQYIAKLPHNDVTELIALNEVKDQLKIDRTDTLEDDLLIHYRDAAIKFAETYTNRNFLQAKYQIQLFEFCEMLPFLKSPVTSIDEITYLDIEGNWQPLPEANYSFLQEDEFQSYVLFNSDEEDLPQLKSGYGVRIKINITVGYEDAEALPTDDKQAIFLAFTFFYDKREDTVQNLPRASTNLLQRFYCVNE